jgi:hypothetical protein
MEEKVVLKSMVLVEALNHCDCKEAPDVVGGI